MRHLCLALLFVAACDDASNVCGDGFVDISELCDDGNTTSGDGCSATCTAEPNCGNGHVDTGEQCDDGNHLPGDGCSASCTSETCGNQVVDAGEQCDDGNAADFDGCTATCRTEHEYTITAAWPIRTVADPTVLPCPTGYDTAAVYSQPVDAAGANVGPPIIDLFNCSAGSGTTGPLYQGRYKVWIAITDTGGASVYATSVPALLDLNMNLSLTAQILTDGGYFAFAWTLIGAVSSNTLTCAAASADSVELVATLSGTTTATSDIFDCLDGRGVTAGIDAGTYVVSISANDAANQAVGTAPSITRDIQAPNIVTDLGTVMIPITGL